MTSNNNKDLLAMKTRVFLILGSILFLTSCAARVTSTIHSAYLPLDFREEVIVFGLNEEVPPSAKNLGTIRVGDSGFSTRCDFATVLEAAKMEARAVGGNVLQITEHRTPDFWSTCHRITAEVFRLENIEDYIVTDDDDDESINAYYAIIHIFRAGGNALINYDLHLNDAIIARVSSNFYKSVRVYNEGWHTLWARTETRTEMPIYIQFGRTYYVRCGVRMGVMMGRPSIEIVQNNIGRAEFNAIQERRNRRNR